jgi:hypothetical protein
MSQIEMYKTKDKQTEIEVRFRKKLYGLHSSKCQNFSDKPNKISSLHINNCYRKELQKSSTVKESLTVQRKVTGRFQENWL